jgi:beta-phosphoglucomutase
MNLEKHRRSYQMENKMYSAVIFDMDGVLVDSEPVIEAAAIKGLSEFGVEAKPEDFIPFIGAGEDKYIGGVAEKYGVPFRLEMKARVYSIYLDMVPGKLKIYNGARELLFKLKEAGWKVALASSADKIKIEANLRVAEIPTSVFDAIICGEDVVKKKPFPEIYLKAAEKIHISPEDCIVVEDALNGIQAAIAAGMRCIAVKTSFAEEKLKKEGPDYICRDIDEAGVILDNIGNGID